MQFNLRDFTPCFCTDIMTMLIEFRAMRAAAGARFFSQCAVTLTKYLSPRTFVLKDQINTCSIKERSHISTFDRACSRVLVIWITTIILFRCIMHGENRGELVEPSHRMDLQGSYPRNRALRTMPQFVGHQLLPRNAKISFQKINYLYGPTSPSSS